MSLLPRHPEFFEMDALSVDNSLLKEWIRQALPFLKMLNFSGGKYHEKIEELLKFASERWRIG